MNVFKKTSHEGVWYRESATKGKIYHIRYRHQGKQVRQTIGSSKEKITPMFCKNILDETKVKLRLGEAAPIKNNSKGKIITLDMAAKEYWLKKSEAKSIKNLKSVYQKHLQNRLGNKDIYVNR